MFRSSRGVLGGCLLAGVALAIACSSDGSGPVRGELTEGGTIGTTGNVSTTGSDSTISSVTSGAGGGIGVSAVMSGGIHIGDGSCGAASCAEVGHACGKMIDDCGNVIDCATEGLICGPFEDCVAGDDGLARCQVGIDCDVCGAIPDCSGAAQPTRLSGRVVTPGRDDANTANQVGVPNAIVYILQKTDVAALPSITSGIPAGADSCDRCAEEDLGPWLTGTTTDATGRFTIEDNIPVGVEFVMVVKVGKFRRAATFSLPETAACTTTELPADVAQNPARLPRHMADGLAVNIPRIAVSTGPIDAMECVIEKMGIASTEFGNPGDDASAAQRVHLYRGGPGEPGSGARIDDTTPHDSALYGSVERLQTYDLVVADCEGGDYDVDLSQATASGANVREYVNRGGRLFASHLSYSWLHQNGDAAYSEADPFATGLGPAATWETGNFPGGTDENGMGAVSVGRPQASPRVDSFAAWLVNEGVITGDATAGYTTFNITDPRSAVTELAANVEEFVYRTDGNERSQQFSFDTPYGSPETAACGRVAYSGFHVAATGGGTTPFEDATFPAHCSDELANSGNLTNQEKVLLYMLFDLATCVGDTPDIPRCTPRTCSDTQTACGRISDGCGDVVDCGPCMIP